MDVAYTSIHCGRGGAAVREPFASGDPAPLPEVRSLFALYMTIATVVLVLLICAADLVVLLLHPPVVGLVGLLSVVAPLYAVLLAAFTSLVNVSIVRRMSRVPRGGYVGYVEYGGRGALRALLQLLSGQHTSRRLPVVSLALLLVCLPLAAVPHVPPTTPLIGALGSWQEQSGDTVALAVSTPPATDANAATTISTATALPTIPGAGTATEPPSNTAPPTATTRPIGRPTATATRAAATATPTSGPVIHFSVSPTTTTYSTCGSSTSPPPVTLTLDNTKSTVAVSWQATAVESVSGGPWADISPAGGTVPPGGTRSTTVTPASHLCQSSPQSWHVDIATTNAGSSTFVYIVS
jgi:hypothetical protein